MALVRVGVLAACLGGMGCAEAAARPPTTCAAGPAVAPSAERAPAAAPSVERAPAATPSAERAPAATPIAANDAPSVSTFVVVMAADGTVTVNGVAAANDDAILAAAKAAREKDADVRARIDPDKAVFHRRVIHVLDLLKQAQISKIAFGVVPATTP